MHVLTPDSRLDQASGLRRMVNPRPVRAIAVTGGITAAIGASSSSSSTGTVSLASQARQPSDYCHVEAQGSQASRKRDASASA